MIDEVEHHLGRRNRMNDVESAQSVTYRARSAMVDEWCVVSDLAHDLGQS
jgi:hypothetical protein